MSPVALTSFPRGPSAFILVLTLSRGPTLQYPSRVHVKLHTGVTGCCGTPLVPPLGLMHSVPLRELPSAKGSSFSPSSGSLHIRTGGCRQVPRTDPLVSRRDSSDRSSQFWSSRWHPLSLSCNCTTVLLLTSPASLALLKVLSPFLSYGTQSKLTVLVNKLILGLVPFACTL